MRKKQRKFMSFLILTGFMLGIKDGYIALWKGEDPQPCRIFSVKAQTLPLSDQLRLRQGIRIESPEQLLALAEDFLESETP